MRLPYDFDDVISLIAPRPVLIVQPTMDREAASGEVKVAVEKAKAIYLLYKAGDKLGLQEPDDYGRLTAATQDAAIEWMQKNINN